MLLAIDVGNTQTVYGLWDGNEWCRVWRRATNAEETEDELAVWLAGLFQLAKLDFAVAGIVAASVVPSVNQSLSLLADRWFRCPIRFLTSGAQVGISVDYSPPTAVGADRIANALGGLAQYQPPMIIVDFGTATTFDCIDSRGVYVGGAILPGITVSTQALVGRTAKLPSIELVAPETAIGKTTVHSLQSGIMLGYAGAIDAIATRIKGELGGQALVVSTGGLGDVFLGLCASIEQYAPNLTLDGLRLAYDQISPR
ncbi:MAG TPA: type III pantothenate kinase [Fimbriimonadaceae bacterium]|nr:type III pantothenate kinase [Fimbriimonadaceae bacterium]